MTGGCAARCFAAQLLFTILFVVLFPTPFSVVPPLLTFPVVASSTRSSAGMRRSGRSVHPALVLGDQLHSSRLGGFAPAATGAAPARSAYRDLGWPTACPRARQAATIESFAANGVAYRNGDPQLAQLCFPGGGLLRRLGLRGDGLLGDRPAVERVSGVCVSAW